MSIYEKLSEDDIEGNDLCREINDSKMTIDNRHQRDVVSSEAPLDLLNFLYSMAKMFP